jgi:hypothetical protein
MNLVFNCSDLRKRAQSHVQRDKHEQAPLDPAQLLQLDALAAGTATSGPGQIVLGWRHAAALTGFALGTLAFKPSVSAILPVRAVRPTLPSRPRWRPADLCHFHGRLGVPR